MKTIILFAIFSFNTAGYLPQPQLKQEPVLVVPAQPVEWVEMVEGVKHFEGFRSEPYLCPSGVLTIGYGHTDTTKELSFVSKQEAHKLLVEDLKEAKAHVERIVTVPLSDAQMAALTSFTFNCGQGSLHKLVSGPDRLNAGNYDSIKEILPLYRKGNGKVLRGLEKRRAFELTLWNKSDNLLAAK